MPEDFLQLAGRAVLVTGVANRKSVAWHIAKLLTAADCTVLYSVRSEARQEQVQKLAGPEAPVFVCDVEHQDQIDRLASEVQAWCDANGQKLAGMVHSIAFADYEDMDPEQGPRPFHETTRRAMLRTFDISCFSLVALANALKHSMDRDASVVTISISTTEMANENYGYMAPIKAALDSAVVFLAKSFSRFGRVRFNAVSPGLLKTSASAGIPGYADAWLFAEQATLRKRGLGTDEAASTALFLLSPRSSGINGQGLVVDAGMGSGYFDRELVRRASAPESAS